MARLAGTPTSGTHLFPPPQGRDHKNMPQLSDFPSVIGIKPWNPPARQTLYQLTYLPSPVLNFWFKATEVQITSLFLSGFCVKIFYIKPIKYKGSVKKGEKLGTLLPLQKVYPGIQSHVHIENCDSSDPTAYLWAQTPPDPVQSGAQTRLPWRNVRSNRNTISANPTLLIPTHRHPDLPDTQRTRVLLYFRFLSPDDGNKQMNPNMSRLYFRDPWTSCFSAWEGQRAWRSFHDPRMKRCSHAGVAHALNEPLMLRWWNLSHALSPYLCQASWRDGWSQGEGRWSCYPYFFMLHKRNRLPETWWWPPLEDSTF